MDSATPIETGTDSIKSFEDGNHRQSSLYMYTDKLEIHFLTFASNNKDLRSFMCFPQHNYSYSICISDIPTLSTFHFHVGASQARGNSA